MIEPFVLDGRKTAEEIYASLPQCNGEQLAILTVGDDPASIRYVTSKFNACDRLGLVGMNYRYGAEGITSYDVATKIIPHIRQLNEDENVHGIIVQRPYPAVLGAIEECIEPTKDVDGLCLKNMHKTLTGKEPLFYPATAIGIIDLLDRYKVAIEGKVAVVIGRSEIVGLPVAAMLRARNATVIQCHSKTRNLKELCRQADIIISAVGKAKFIDETYITELVVGSTAHPARRIGLKYPVMIDVGMNRDKDGKLCGDIDMDRCMPYVSGYTTVPGGVGPMTVVELMKNVCKFIRSKK